MTRKTIDCRTVPHDVGCTLAISGEPGELVTAPLSMRLRDTRTPTPRNCASRLPLAG